jgi:hypothetical protein
VERRDEKMILIARATMALVRQSEQVDLVVPRA